MPLIYPNILDCLWCILIYWIVCDVSQFIGCTTTNKPIILRAGLLYMTQFIGWTTTHKPLNLKDWPLYMTQYIWSYSFAAQSKLMPFYHHFSIVKYSYLPSDTFRKYVEMHVTRSKLTLKFTGYCRHTSYTDSTVIHTLVPAVAWELQSQFAPGYMHFNIIF